MFWVLPSCLKCRDNAARKADCWRRWGAPGGPALGPIPWVCNGGDFRGLTPSHMPRWGVLRLVPLLAVHVLQLRLLPPADGGDGRRAQRRLRALGQGQRGHHCGGSESPEPGRHPSPHSWHGQSVPEGPASDGRAVGAVPLVLVPTYRAPAGRGAVGQSGQCPACSGPAPTPSSGCHHAARSGALASPQGTCPPLPSACWEAESSPVRARPRTEGLGSLADARLRSGGGATRPPEHVHARGEGTHVSATGYNRGTVIPRVGVFHS